MKSLERKAEAVFLWEDQIVEKWVHILIIWIFLSAVICMFNFSYQLFTYYLIFMLVKTVINSFTISDSLLQPPSQLLKEFEPN